MTPDLIDAVAGVVGEDDGDVHLGRGAKHRDVRRDDLYRTLGLEQVTVMAPDLREPESVVSRLYAAYGRAAARATSDRAWTVQSPSWWRPTLTVAQRRALSPAERARLLRHRQMSWAVPMRRPS